MNFSDIEMPEEENKANMSGVEFAFDVVAQPGTESATALQADNLDQTAGNASSNSFRKNLRYAWTIVYLDFKPL